MPNVSTTFVFPIVHQRYVHCNTECVRTVNVYRHVTKWNVPQGAVNVSKVCAKSNAVVELLVRMQFMSLLKIRTTLTPATFLVLTLEQEYRKFLLLVRYQMNTIALTVSLRKKCPYSEFFWSVFSPNA